MRIAKMMICLVGFVSLVGCGASEWSSSQQRPEATTTSRQSSNQPTVKPSQTQAIEAPGEAVTPLVPTGAATAVPTQAAEVPSATSEAVPGSGSSPETGSAPAAIIYRARASRELYALDPVSGKQMVLAHSTGDWAPAPDGRTIAVIAGIEGGGPKQHVLERASLWVVGINESNPRKLLDLVGGSPLQSSPTSAASELANSHGEGLIWTLDGREIITRSAHEGQVDLYTVAVDGSGARRLTNTPDFEFDLHLSPDGRHVAYMTVTSFGTGAGWGDVAAWIVPVAGGAPHALSGRFEGPYEPASGEIIGWSNDHTAVAYTLEQASGTMIWTAAYQQQPRSMVIEAFLRAEALQGERLLFAALPLARDGSGAMTELWSWHSSEQAPALVSLFEQMDLGSIEEIIPLPGSDVLVLCNGHPQGVQLFSLADGTLLQRPDLRCQELRQSDQGLVAFGGAQGGAILDQTGAVLHSWEQPVVQAGWYEETLYYFAAPVQGQWQLYRMAPDEQEEPIGEPLRVELYGAWFVGGR